MIWLDEITYEQACALRREFGTPCFLYAEDVLRAATEAAKGFPAAYGLTVRYAMKAAPNANLLRRFRDWGLSFDASSLHEALRLETAGVPLERVSLSSQQLDPGFVDLHRRGMAVNACSLDQLRRFGEAFPGGRVGLRFNPGLGSGGTNRTNVGGPASSFGIWHESLETARELAAKHGLVVERIHSHIGSGSDPEVWKRVAGMTLDLARAFATVETVNLGGGYKVARMPGETASDLQLIGGPVRALFERFAEETGRKLRLEIEPGTFLVANAGAVLASVDDVVGTGEEGYRFIKLDTGMTEILRPSLYGAQHPIRILHPRGEAGERDYVVVGHCCESGDILTPAPGDPELLAPRRLPEARAGDLCLVGGAGAYCAAMSAKNYNSYPEAPEVLLGADGTARLIRRRQTLAQIIENEIAVE